MHICSCRPVDEPLTTAAVVKHVAEGASTMKDIVLRSGAGTNCGGCAPSLSRVKGAVLAIARERDEAAGRAGAAWPTTDEMVRADAVITKAILR